MSQQTIVLQNLTGELVTLDQTREKRSDCIWSNVYDNCCPTCPRLHAILPLLPCALSLLLPAASSVPQFLHESCSPASPMPKTQAKRCLWYFILWFRCLIVFFIRKPKFSVNISKLTQFYKWCFQYIFFWFCLPQYMFTKDISHYKKYGAGEYRRELSCRECGNWLVAERWHISTWYCSRASSLALCSSSKALCNSWHCIWYLLMFFSASALPLFAPSKAISNSLISASSFFLILMASALPRASASNEACMESSALWWFFLNIKTYFCRK